MITISAFKWVPPFAQGLVRDLRVRWALEEAGIPYEVKLIGPEDQRSADYLASQPFGQVPILTEGNVTLFESGSIVLHIGEKSEKLLPKDDVGRSKAITWLFAALNSIEIYVAQYAELDLFFKGADWTKERKPIIQAQLQRRLHDLAERLGDREWFEDRFTVGDLMMCTVLRNLRHDHEVLPAEPRLEAFKARCEARPAFQRALSAQMAAFENNAPKPS